MVLRSYLFNVDSRLKNKTELTRPLEATDVCRTWIVTCSIGFILWNSKLENNILIDLEILNSSKKSSEDVAKEIKGVFGALPDVTIDCVVVEQSVQNAITVWY